MQLAHIIEVSPSIIVWNPSCNKTFKQNFIQKLHLNYLTERLSYGNGYSDHVNIMYRRHDLYEHWTILEEPC